MITVLLHGAFREFAGGRRRVVVEAATVGGALQRLVESVPSLRERLRDEHGRLREHLNVFANDEKIDRLAGEATPLRDGDTVQLLPAISGGTGKGDRAVKRGVIVMVGTKKGAYLWTSGPARTRWTREGPLFPGEPVYQMAFDPRDGASMYAACNLSWGGPKIQVSRDLGKTWTVGGNPAFPEGHRNTFRHTWHIEAGHVKTPEVVWAGVAPAGLFRSADRGMSWQPVLSLIDHPTSEQWSPGGAGETMLHSIAVDPGDPKRVAVGISGGGVYLTEDGGASWRPWNEGTRAEFLPNKYPEVGQCVHHLVAHPRRPGVFFQRNHNRVYFRDAGETRWEDRQKGLPTDFGFAGTLDPHDPDTAYVIPLDERVRLAPEPGIAVYRTSDRGRSWKRLDRGLPKRAPAEVMREGLSTDRLDPVGLYFGTVNGEVWASPNGGRSFERIAAYLPPILSVSAATLA